MQVRGLGSVVLLDIHFAVMGGAPDIRGDESWSCANAGLPAAANATASASARRPWRACFGVGIDSFSCDLRETLEDTLP